MAGLHHLLVFISATCLAFGVQADEQTTQAEDVQTTTQQARPPARICVVSKFRESCQSMALDLPDSFVCVIGRDKMDCAEKIQQGLADISNMDAQSLYISGKYFGVLPLVMELVKGDPHRYQGVALVRSDVNISSLNDLKGLRSCHTGVDRTVGWQIPIGILLSRGAMEPDCRGDLQNVESFFNGSCAAGPWVSDPNIDAELKKRHPSLCAQCHDPQNCSASDLYRGYEGSIRCIAEGSGDVAFTKIPVLRDYLKKDPNISQYLQLLCLDGTKKSVLDEDPCVWGTRPTNTFVVSSSASEKERERLTEILTETADHYLDPNVSSPKWLHEAFYSHDTVSGLRPVPPQKDTWNTYLGDFVHAIQRTKEFCNYNPVRFCVTSEEEKRKCEDYSRAVDGRSLIPPVECVITASKVACMEAIKQGDADIAAFDGGDVYKAGRYYDLVPVSAEMYGELDASYYAVALLRSASDVTTLSELRGLRSCHTGMGRTAGWVIPVGALIEQDLIPEKQCNRAEGVADFFASSCVPGANDTKYNPGRTRADDLCRRCVGDENGEHRCARDSRERYSGYSGAMRCLSEGAGDVAFVKHTTVPQYTDGRGDVQWSKDLLSSDFQLLCRKGGRKQVNEYLDCNLAKVPSHYVMTGGNASADERLSLATLLAQSARYFGPESTTFKLFGAYKDSADLLFKDSTTNLQSAALNASYIDALGVEFYKASSVADPKNCQSS